MHTCLILKDSSAYLDEKVLCLLSRAASILRPVIQMEPAPPRRPPSQLAPEGKSVVPHGGFFGRFSSRV